MTLSHTMKLRLFDAHNHLQDDRFGGRQRELMLACEQEGLIRMVVNGSCEQDWPHVVELARQYPQVLPSFGYHPWYQHERTPQWKENLLRFLDQASSAVGEIGLDQFGAGPGPERQVRFVAAQLALVAGATLLLCGLLRMGFLANFFSRPVMSGFTVGSAIVIAAGLLAGAPYYCAQGQLRTALWNCMAPRVSLVAGRARMISRATTFHGRFSRKLHSR